MQFLPVNYLHQKINPLKNKIVLPEKVSEEIRRATEVLKQGGIILYPTDTIWGIGCDACNPEAVEKVYKIKNRPASKSMIILLDEARKLNLYVDEVPGIAWDWVELTEKPLTIIYQGAKKLAANLINPEDGSIAIRVVKEDEFCISLIRKFGRPIVSTSANLSGSKAPQCFRDIEPAILQAVDYVVNLRQNEAKTRAASDIVSILPNGVFKFIRK
jgi:L-threonylcarbamoyladenylate synthase